MLLPGLGGSPAVWNTCVFFFQAMLLAGYLYAHWLMRLPQNGQAAIHMVLLLVAVSVLPEELLAVEAAGTTATTIWSLLRGLLLFAGLPFFVLASTAPLLQRWFACIGVERSKDPYFLYAASNAGSLAALLCFPLLLERILPISQQVVLWSRTYLFVSLGVAACLAYAWLRRDTRPTTTARTSVEHKVRPRQVASWLMYAAIPSSLTLGVTTHITTDIAAVSWLWIVPLALYLASYVVAFSALAPVAVLAARWLLPLVIAASLIVIFKGEPDSLLQVPVNLALAAIVSLVMHFQLYEARPRTERLTSFYLFVALGGLIGGSFNSLVAPLVFDRVIEFHLVLIVAVAIVERDAFRNFVVRFREANWNGIRARELAAVLIIVSTVGLAGFGLEQPLRTLGAATLMAVCIGACAYACGLASSIRAIAAVCLISYLGVSATVGGRDSLYADRSFFGHFAVVEEVQQGVPTRKLVHGTTLHGLQAQTAEEELSLQSYYAPIGDVLIDFLDERPAAAIAVVGLGTGNLACVGRPQDAVRFYEIDAKIEYVAREYFTFLDKCPAAADVVIGDGRTMLSRADDAAFDMVVLDAFSSNAVPVHLLTLEAAELYQRVLKDDGLIVMHISNRYLDLRPVAHAMAQSLGWNLRVLRPALDPADSLAIAGVFVVATRSETNAEFLNRVPAAEFDGRRGGFRIWTDDYSSLWSVLLL